MKIGRNQPCPCGSDKKYKLCCEGKLSPHLEDYHGLLQKENHIRTKIFQWTRNRFSADEIQEFLKDFTGKGFEEFIKDEEHFPFFLDWLLFEGIMPDTGKSVLAAAREEIVLEREEQEIFDQWLENTQAGIYEIQEANPHQNYLIIKEVYTGKSYEITDVQGSKTGIRGDFFFGRVQHLFSRYYLSGVLQLISRAIFLEFKEHLLKKYRWAKLKNPLLSYEKFINKASKIVFLFNPQVPQLFNVSGEKIVVCEAKYSLLQPCAEEIVAWLAQDSKCLITEENYNSQGEIISAEIGYLADKEKIDARQEGQVVFGQWISEEGKKYTTMDAHISIKKSKLILFSQSKKRYAAWREKIEAEFGSRLKLVHDEQKPVEEIMEGLNRREPKKSSPKRKSSELRELEEKFCLQYYKDEWCKARIPLLGNKTPREAVGTEEGKKKVKELLLDLENEQLHRQREGEGYIPIEKILREELGLND